MSAIEDGAAVAADNGKSEGGTDDEVQRQVVLLKTDALQNAIFNRPTSSTRLASRWWRAITPAAPTTPRS